MATIIPNIDLENIENSNKISIHSDAEKKIIKKILCFDNAKTKDWIIYYSFYFKGREDCGYYNNEIDFLFLIPNGGIFTFEIKGGRIKNENNKLFSIDRKGERHDIDPYNQSKNNYYNLSDIVKKLSNQKEIKDFTGGCLVGFPDISECPDVGVQSNKIDTYTSKMDLYEFICRNIRYAKENLKGKKVPTKENIDEIIQKLKGENFIFSLNKSDYIKSINLRIDELTEEQMTVFKGLLNNDRCLIRGSAGTGKTVLCEFLYKHMRDIKNSVLYLTFNRLISQKISLELENNDSAKCYPIMDYLKEEYIRATGDSKIFNLLNYSETKIFLLKNINKIVDNEKNLKKYDCLIIDEAQDIDFNVDTQLFLDSILNKGFENGKCYIFFDDKQNIFNNISSNKIYNSEIFGSGRGGYRYSKFELTKNCRNCKGIQESIEKLLHNKSKKLSEYGKSLTNNETKFFTIDESREGALKIKEEIDKLKEEGVKNNQITLLFNLRTDNFENVIFNELQKMYQNGFEPYNPEGNRFLNYATVASFKGLENDVIIYVNDNLRSDLKDHYVAVSRAKVYSYIFRTV